MASVIITNIKLLVGVQDNISPLRGEALGKLPVLEQAWLLIDKGRIRGFGVMDQPDLPRADERIDARGSLVLPAWCDSHTHLVYAASREDEFVQKLRGASYAEIAAAGGGILNSARRLAVSTEDELLETARGRLAEVISQGTGAIEIKSGYGLSPDAELKMLRVIRRLREESPIPVRATFLGAHAFPLEFKDDHAGYIRQITEEMLPRIAAEGLADYIDVFCEQGFFSVSEMEEVVSAGMSFGLKPKLHVNQLNSLGGLSSAIGLGARSVDHLETMTPEDIRELAASPVIGTLLPTAAFFLRMGYQPATDLIRAGAAIALASDFNPGSSPSGNMNFVVALACIQMRLSPAEAINAATVNGAFAMDLQEELGSITVGKLANLIITQPVPSLEYLPYAFGSNHVRQVLINGKPI